MTQFDYKIDIIDKTKKIYEPFLKKYIFEQKYKIITKMLRITLC